jgi:hypothetical protein
VLSFLSGPLVWVCHGGMVQRLQPLYGGPYAVLRRGPCSFTIRLGSRDEVSTVSRLKACTAADAKPGSLRRCGRPLDSHPGGLAATKRVSFSDLLVSSPYPPAPPRDGPGTIFLPSEDVFACLGPAAPSQAPDAVLVPILSMGTATEVGPLTSSPSSRGQSSGGALWRPAYTPGGRSHQLGVLQQACTVPLYKLICNCHNKPVLSNLSLRLLLKYVLLWDKVLKSSIEL